MFREKNTKLSKVRRLRHFLAHLVLKVRGLKHPLAKVSAASYNDASSSSALVSINEVALQWARLVLGWVTVCGRVNYLGL